MKILLVTPAQAGIHVPDELDSGSPAFAEDKFRGNDEAGVIFGGAQGAVEEPGLPQFAVGAPALVDGSSRKDADRRWAQSATLRFAGKRAGERRDGFSLRCPAPRPPN
jgi:hypothetical protein